MRRPKSRRRGAAVVVRTACVVGGLAAGIMVAEVVARAWWAPQARERERLFTEYFRPDPYAGSVHVPSTTIVFPFPEHPAKRIVFRTNNLGLRRDADTTTRKPPGTTRVVILGDSHTEGVVPNDESYATRLEKALVAGGPRPVEVLNAGVGGYHPLLELQWLRSYGLRLAPDLVILALYTGNDLAELMTTSHHEFCGTRRACGIVPDGERPAIARVQTPTMLGRARAWIARRSALYGLLKAVSRRPPIVGWLSRGGVIGSPTLKGAAHACRDCLWQDLAQAHVARTNATAIEPAFEATSAILSDIADETRRNGAGLVFLVLPSRRQVEPEEDEARVAAARRILDLSAEEAAFSDRVHRAFVTSGRRLGIPTADALPALRSAYVARRRPLYWHTDWHLNSEGHAVVADFLMAFLCGDVRPERLRCPRQGVERSGRPRGG
jgi:lysophospholipase L1-like esterase